ncbi:unnamed protein product [Durusdinium trenchii]|uniref:Uncharacterized protein n=2 Tax=Durusdinium trenchii TaxID=1381693 RepID=A0ABP0NSC0_9DINO
MIMVRSQQLLAGAMDGAGSIWDLEEHTKVDDFHHGAELNAAAVSFDGALFATAGSDRQVAIWQRDASRDSGSPHATLTGHRGQVYSISFCPVTPTLFSASGDATARLWSLSSGQELMSLNWHTRDVNTVAPAPDGHVLATGSDDYCFALWDRRTGERIRSWDGRRGEGHSGRVYSVAFAPDGHSIATGAVDKKAKVWDTRTGACLQAFTSHTDLVNSVSFSPDGKLLASASDDCLVHVWAPGTAELLATYRHPSNVLSASFAENGQLATGCDDGKIRLWDASSNEELSELVASVAKCAGIKSVAFIP